MKDIKVTLQAQHPGNWGPWYHESVYRLTNNGTWRFVCECGRLGHGDSRYLTPTEWREKTKGMTRDQIISALTEYNNQFRAI